MPPYAVPALLTAVAAVGLSLAVTAVGHQRPSDQEVAGRKHNKILYQQG